MKTWTSTVTLSIICKNTGQKLHALGRVAKFMDQEKLQTVMNAFIMSKFSDCRLNWKFHDRNVNNKINKINKRALRIAFKYTSSKIEDLLKKAASVTIRQRNVQLLATEICKTNHILTLNSWMTSSSRRASHIS